MTAVHVLYVGSESTPVESLLEADRTTVFVHSAPTPSAAVTLLSEIAIDCVVAAPSIDKNSLARIRDAALGVPCIHHGDGLGEPLRRTVFEAIERREAPTGEEPTPIDGPAPPAWIVHLDGDGTYLRVVEGRPGELASTPSELPGNSVEDAPPVAGASIPMEEANRAVETGTIRQCELAADAGPYRCVFVPAEDGTVLLIGWSAEDREYRLWRSSRSNDFTDAVIDRLDDIFFVFDFHGNFVRWNDRLNEVTGYTDEEIVSMSPMAFFAEDDHGRVESALSAVATAGNATESVHLKTKRGRLIPYEFTGSIVADGSGTPRYICGIGRDVSGRHRSERALRTREGALPNLIQNLPGLVYRYRNEESLPVEFMSRGCTALTGYEHDRLENDEVVWGRDVIHPDDRDEVWGTVSNAAERGEQYQITYRIRTADDEVRWVWEQGRPVDSETGDVEFLDGYVTEITDIVEIEEQLRKEKAFTENALDAQQDVFYVFGTDGRMLRWNDRLNEVTGYTDEEIEGMHPTAFVEAEEVDRITDAIEAVAGQGRARTIEATLVTSDGERIPYEFTGSVIDDVGGIADDADTYICGAGRDISQRVRAERELEEAINELERSNAELERFAYVASHDLKEPLRMIGSYLDLIQRRYEGELDDDADEFIGYAVDGADRMRRMIDDLLAYSRIGTEDVQFEPIDCDSVLERVQEDLTVAIEESDAEVVVDDLPTVEGDRHQLVQLFQNLISNAITYAGDADPRIEVSCRSTDGEWLFSVTDNGVGIGPDQTEEVFEIFSSGSDGSSTGIGLAICQKIVRRHGGEIWVESEPGVGSTFFFTIPAERRADAGADRGDPIDA